MYKSLCRHLCRLQSLCRQIFISLKNEYLINLNIKL